MAASQRPTVLGRSCNAREESSEAEKLDAFAFQVEQTLVSNAFWEACRSDDPALRPTSAARAWALDRGRLRRMLRGHRGQVEKAAATMRWCLEQRSQLGLWTLDPKEVQEELRLGKYYCRCLDREGHPVLHYRQRRADNTLDVLMRLRAFAFFVDSVETRMDHCAGMANTWVLILDLSGKALKGSASFEYLSRVLKLVLRCYPGRLHRCFVVDTSMIWNVFWNAACKILEADTVRKVCFVRRSRDKEGQPVVQELLQQVGESKLEVEYGGQNVFEWDPERHWLVSELMLDPTAKPLEDAPHGTEAEATGSDVSIDVETASVASDEAFEDAVSVCDDAVVTMDVVLAECQALVWSLRSCDEGRRDARLLKLQRELRQTLQDFSDSDNSAGSQSRLSSSTLESLEAEQTEQPEIEASPTAPPKRSTSRVLLEAALGEAKAIAGLRPATSNEDVNSEVGLLAKGPSSASLASLGPSDASKVMEHAEQQRALAASRVRVLIATNSATLLLVLVLLFAWILGLMCSCA